MEIILFSAELYEFLLSSVNVRCLTGITTTPNPLFSLLRVVYLPVKVVDPHVDLGTVSEVVETSSILRSVWTETEKEG